MVFQQRSRILKQLEFNKCKYEDCGHEWLPRSVQDSRYCPGCHRRGWQVGVRPPKLPMGPRVRHAVIVGEERGSVVLARLRSNQLRELRKKKEEA